MSRLSQLGRLWQESGFDISSAAEPTPAHIASGCGLHDQLAELIATKSDINASDGQGWTPLHYAIEAGGDRTMALLLESNADPNAPRSSSRTRPLQLACRSGQERLASLLLKAKADVDGADANGCTALHEACRRQRPRLVLQLLGVGADANVRDSSKRAPIHFAAAFPPQAPVQKGPQGQTFRANSTLENLVSASAKVNARCGQKRTALHVAAAAGLPGVVQDLLNNKAEVDACDAHGMSALHHAAATGVVARNGVNPPTALMVLLRAGAATNVTDGAGRTASDILRALLDEPTVGLRETETLAIRVAQAALAKFVASDAAAASLAKEEESVRAKSGRRKR